MTTFDANEAREIAAKAASEAVEEYAKRHEEAVSDPPAESDVEP